MNARRSPRNISQAKRASKEFYDLASDERLAKFSEETYDKVLQRVSSRYATIVTRGFEDELNGDNDAQVLQDDLINIVNDTYNRKERNFTAVQEKIWSKLDPESKRGERPSQCDIQ